MYYYSYVIVFLIVLHIFLPESTRIWAIQGILCNRILAILPAKIVISIPQNSSGFWNGTRITEMESTGTESPEYFFIVIVNFKYNSNYLIVFTIN